jgi:hypothetical protein
MTTNKKRLATMLGVAMLAAGPIASAWATNRDSCPPKQMVALETKSCPDGQAVSRACCTRDNKKGEKTHCKPFPKCPKPTRS